MPFEAATRHRLLWAALPDPETASRITELVQRERARHGLTGRSLQTGRLHVTLYHVGDDIVPPAATQIADLVHRASNVVMPKFRVSFDYIQSFRNGAFVLCGDDGVIGFDVLHQRLRLEILVVQRADFNEVMNSVNLRRGLAVAGHAADHAGLQSIGLTAA